MKTQEAYELMRAWLTRPGAARAYDSDVGLCMYITDGGNRCAVGAILSPAAVEEVRELEGGINNILSGGEYPTARSELEGVDPVFLGACQSVHDAADSWTWDEDGNEELFIVAELDDIAKQNDLKVVTDEETRKIPANWWELPGAGLVKGER